MSNTLVALRRNTTSQQWEDLSMSSSRKNSVTYSTADREAGEFPVDSDGKQAVEVVSDDPCQAISPSAYL